MDVPFKNFAANFQNTFFKEHLWRAAPDTTKIGKSRVYSALHLDVCRSYGHASVQGVHLQHF